MDNNMFEKLVAPVKELNELTLKSIEKIAAIQTKSVQENAKISISSLQSANQIKDFDTLQEYLKEQLTVAQNLSDKAVEGAQEIAKLSETYAEEVKGVVEKFAKQD